MNYMLSVATYISLPRSAGTLWPLAQPPTILAAPRHQFSHHPKGGERALASSTPTTSTSYGACRKGTSLTLPISSPLRFSTRWSSIGRGSSPLAPT
ncbi:hypothetical protein PVK06_034404 [Gossypium arboreum]|uniref:Uncharacterized protein n=1 Tax=Gossypium arboreum TaxID=29729 RepID=A0ABR0NH01_GOSAR|nr:hypothetical protein PVK06_034404 [Gossypium arboreum]